MSNILEEIINLLSKTVKGDEQLLYHILFCGLSAHTDKPNHTMIMEKSSEGKTYPVMEVSKYFPKENVIILANATPQSLKYEHGILVDKQYNPIKEKIDQLKRQCNNPKEVLRQIEELQSSAKTLIDLREKWIIFKEPPNPSFLEMLYSTLSSDQEYSEYKITPDSGKGRRKTYTVVFRGTPALLICTAKDETKAERWEETASRFTLVSPKASSQKYEQGMNLIAKSYGLPKELYDEYVISSEEKDRLKMLILMLIQQIKTSKGNVFDPFQNELPRIFPKDSGMRMRQFQRLQTMIRLHCLCFAQDRPHMITSDGNIPVITLEDVNWAVSLMRDKEDIPPHKFEWFKNIFFPTWEQYSIPLKLGVEIKSCIIGQDLKIFADTKIGVNHNIKKIRETFLNSLVSFGLVERHVDPRKNSRDVYWPTNVEEKSSSIAISSINKDEVAFFVKTIQRRFPIEYNGEVLSNEKIVEIILK